MSKNNNGEIFKNKRQTKLLSGKVGKYTQKGKIYRTQEELNKMFFFGE